MSQTVLPQVPMPEMTGEMGKKKPSVNRGKEADSPFDNVSRAEQKRLDRQQEKRAGGNEASSRADEPTRTGDADKADRKKADRKEAEAEREQGASPTETAGKKPSDREPGDESVADVGKVLVPLETGELLEGSPEEPIAFTFANLQALVGTEGTAAGASSLTPNDAGAAVAQGLGLGQLGLMLKGGAAPGDTLQSGPGQTPAAQWVEAILAQAGAEGGKGADVPASLDVSRLRSNGELAALQASSAASAKAAEQGAALKGYATSIDVPVGHAEWGEKLVGKLTWLTANKLSVAEIHLTPPDMGPMEVRVKVNQEQATVTVHSANPVVRDQLELHSHRLRDMLSEQGLSLEQFDVSDSPQQHAGNEPGEEGDEASGQGAALAGDGGEHLTDGEAITGDALDLSWKGEVDLYA